MYTDLKFLKIPKLLRYQDKASMASSVEVRVPFLDHELVEAAFSAPVSLHLREGRTKAVLRDLYAGFGVKDRSGENRKLYVSTPQREWIKKELKREILDHMIATKLFIARSSEADRTNAAAFAEKFIKEK
jgi:asparagine synthase (glutamine-hydrolysing)